MFVLYSMIDVWKMPLMAFYYLFCNIILKITLTIELPDGTKDLVRYILPARITRKLYHLPLPLLSFLVKKFVRFLRIYLWYNTWRPFKFDGIFDL